MSDALLVLNAGSSSVKFSLFTLEDGELVLDVRGKIEEIFTAPRLLARDAEGRVVARKTWEQGTALGHATALDCLLEHLRDEMAHHRLVAAGHRIVHGGPDYRHPVRVDAKVLADLERLIPLAPLHQPHNLAPIRVLFERLPELPQVACLGTSFHRSNPEIAQLFGLPLALHQAGVRRYGFHGASYEYIASVLPVYDARAATGRTVVLHLGSGASMCALVGGRSVASTMGFTALDGLMMGTRAGALDPGVVLWLMQERGMDLRAVEHLLYHESGLRGVSGLSSDMRDLLASTDPRAALAVDLFCYRIRRELGSLAAAIDGLDALVFTAGIGENAAPIRARVVRDAAWLGAELDPAANETGGPRITSPASRVAAWVVPTNEELMIARHTREVVGL